MDEYFDSNRALWDGWTPIHEDSGFYDLEGFRAGKSALKSIELEALGDVRDQALLHLQCHFGLDTLSWARLGARVTGIDFSERAIEKARALAAEQNIDARFLCCNVYQLPADFGAAFDIVYSSYGVLAWLPDLTSWAHEIARCLKPGGTFYMVEFHPLSGMLDDTSGRSLQGPYFHTSEPARTDVRGSYADPAAEFEGVAFEWTHSLGDVVNALVSAGLTLQKLNEFPYTPHPCFPFLEERETGRWYVRGPGPDVPLVFSVRALR